MNDNKSIGDTAVRYWIAINGASCALSVQRWRAPVTIPIAEEMFGFLTLQEAWEAHSIYLKDSPLAVTAWTEDIRADLLGGRIVHRRFDLPGAPTREPIWMEETELAAILKRLLGHEPLH